MALAVRNSAIESKASDTDLSLGTDKRGVTVTVYSCSSWPGGTSEDIRNFEEGITGKYYYYVPQKCGRGRPTADLSCHPMYLLHRAPPKHLSAHVPTMFKECSVLDTTVSPICFYGWLRSRLKLQVGLKAVVLVNTIATSVVIWTLS